MLGVEALEQQGPAFGIEEDHSAGDPVHDNNFDVIQGPEHAPPLIDRSSQSA